MNSEQLKMAAELMARAESLTASSARLYLTGCALQGLCASHPRENRSMVFAEDAVQLADAALSVLARAPA